MSFCTRSQRLSLHDAVACVRFQVEKGAKTAMVYTRLKTLSSADCSPADIDEHMQEWILMADIARCAGECSAEPEVEVVSPSYGREGHGHQANDAHRGAALPNSAASTPNHYMEHPAVTGHCPTAAVPDPLKSAIAHEKRQAAHMTAMVHREIESKRQKAKEDLDIKRKQKVAAVVAAMQISRSRSGIIDDGPELRDLPEKETSFKKAATDDPVASEASAEVCSPTEKGPSTEACLPAESDPADVTHIVSSKSAGSTFSEESFAFRAHADDVNVPSDETGIRKSEDHRRSPVRSHGHDRAPAPSYKSANASWRRVSSMSTDHSQPAEVIDEATADKHKWRLELSDWNLMEESDSWRAVYTDKDGTRRDIRLDEAELSARFGSDAARKAVHDWHTSADVMQAFANEKNVAELFAKASQLSQHSLSRCARSLLLVEMHISASEMKPGMWSDAIRRKFVKTVSTAGLSMPSTLPGMQPFDGPLCNFSSPSSKIKLLDIASRN